MDRTFVLDNSKSPYAFIKTVPMKNIKLSGFMGKYLDRTTKVTIPSQYELLEETGRIDNFRRASGKLQKDFQGFFFNDSDVYKWLEAASSAMINSSSTDKLKEMIDLVIEEIESAQDEDGYLNTYFTFERKKDRWTDLANMHELYCAGHLIQAAIINKRVTGEDKLFKVAVRFADNISETFGKDKKQGAPGHPEIEMALVELYRETGEKKYLDLAEFFIENRGKGYAGGKEYFIDHKPFKELDEVVGHAVRMVYLCCGATDLYMEIGDQKLLETLNRLWENMTTKKMYITGGIGSRHEGEAFGNNYELPNKEAYAETCAAIANFMWNWRMFLITGDSKYTNLMEQVLYNGLISGISLDGKKYFYVNPLEADENHRRQEWFSCACCTTNIIRLLTQFPGYMYSVSDRGIWVNFYEASEGYVNFGKGVKILQQTNYPWDGNVQIEVIPNHSEEFSIFLRIPDWAKNSEVAVNGKKIDKKSFSRGYLEIRKVWNEKDRIELELEMTTELIKSNPKISENIGKIAVKRGPMVYCFEQADNPDIDLSNLEILGDPKSEYVENLLGGIVQIKVNGLDTRNIWRDSLYSDVDKIKTSKRVELKLIPYFAWANREPSKMIVWLPKH